MKIRGDFNVELLWKSSPAALATNSQGRPRRLLRKAIFRIVVHVPHRTAECGVMTHPVG